jgi:hypothetical protein
MTGRSRKGVWMSAIGVLCAGLSGCSPDLPPVGHTWAVDLSQAEWLDPEKIAPYVSLYSDDYPIFVNIQAHDAPRVDMLFVLATDDGQQDTCSRTILMSGVRFKKNGTFEIGPTDFGLANGLNTQELVMTGQMSEDRTELTSIELTGYVDFDTIPPDLFEPAADKTLCETFEALVTCVECPSGSGDCVYTHTTNVTADLLEDVPIEVIDTPDCHETCDASAENPECDL